MTCATAYLPGMEDLPAPPGLAGWDLVLWRLALYPMKRIILLALRRLAGRRSDCCPTNQTILDTIAEMGHTPPSEAGLKAHLRELETREHLIRREPYGRAKSRRRLRFSFLDGGVSHLPPRVQTTFTLGCGSSAPKGADDLYPHVPVVLAAPEPAPTSFLPLNSDSIPEEEETLTFACACACEETGPQAAEPEPAPGSSAPGPEPELPDMTGWPRSLRERFESAMRKVREGEANKPPQPEITPTALEASCPQTPATVLPAPGPAPHTPPRHVETVDLLGRLASPCGPAAVLEAAGRLAEKLGDEHSTAYYRQTCERVRAGEIPVKVVVGAFKQARSGTASCPGAVFNAFIREHSPPGGAQKPGSRVTRQSPPGAGRNRHPLPH